MDFGSLFFLFGFLPVFLLLFWTLKDFRRPWLFISSLLFYAWGEGGYVAYLLVFIVVNYLLGLLVDGTEKPIPKKAFFVLAVFFNLGVLAYFKYSLGIQGSHNIGDARNAIHSPIGISFLTFQSLSFLIDIYRNTVRMDRRPLNFGLYLALFPKLISGPIAPYRDLQAQISAGQPVAFDHFSEGIKRFILGLGKKILIADSLSAPADGIFSLPASDLTAGLSWLGILCFSLQIYFNFSGYTDMAIGVGRMIGVHLPENFNRPYLAHSIRDFWRRWHMSLARWLIDYLFLPIAYKVSRIIKKDRLLRVRAETWAYMTASFITFLACGIWHGAKWTFVVWGAYYALCLVIEHAGMEKRIKRLKGPLQIAYCQILVIIGWVIFRSQSLGYAIFYLKSMFGAGTGNGIDNSAAIYLTPKVIVFLFIGIIGASPAPSLFRSWRRRSKGTTWVEAAGNLFLVLVFVLSVMAMTGGAYNPFIYFRF